MTWSHWLELIFAKQLRTVPRVTRVVVGDTRLVYYEPQDQTPASGAKAEWVQTSLFQGGFEGIGLDEAVRGAIDPVKPARDARAGHIPRTTRLGAGPEPPQPLPAPTRPRDGA
mgnify:CR=1 FL=1